MNNKPMNGVLQVNKFTDKAFRKGCDSLKIEYRCIGEGIDGDKYLVTFDFLSDIYCLGQMVGVESLKEFETQNRNTEDKN